MHLQHGNWNLDTAKSCLFNNAQKPIQSWPHHAMDAGAMREPPVSDVQGCFSSIPSAHYCTFYLLALPQQASFAQTAMYSLIRNSGFSYPSLSDTPWGRLSTVIPDNVNGYSAKMFLISSHRPMLTCATWGCASKVVRLLNQSTVPRCHAGWTATPTARPATSARRVTLHAVCLMATSSRHPQS